ncbi:MAG: recombinase family protein [Cyanobacteria bacterium P01_G01_bin.38]
MPIATPVLRTVAYLYSDLRLEPTPEPTIWGWEVDRVYQDLAPASDPASALKSAPKSATNRDRPQLQQLIADAQTAPPDYLLVRALDELGDTLSAVGDRLATIESLGITVIATEQDYHSSSRASSAVDENTAQAQLLALLAEVQYNQRSRRIRQGHAQKRIQGMLPPGRAPYGYRRGKDRYGIDRTVSPVVKAFFERFIVYGSLRGAVRYLEKRYGKKIAASTGRRWLENPVYRGDTAYQDGRVMPDTHPPIISREEAAQVDRLLRRNRQLPPRTASAPRSLAGLVSCATCGSAMKVSRVTARGKSQVYLYLRPTACPQQPKCKAMAYDAVLEKTIDAICKTLPGAVAQLSLPKEAEGRRAKGEGGGVRRGQGRLAQAGGAEGAEGDREGGGAELLKDQMEQKREVLEQLPGLVARGILDQPTADLRAYQVRTELAALHQKQAALPPVNLQELTQAVAIPQFWQDLSETERRFFFREFIRQVLISRDGSDWTLQLDFIF